MSAGPTSDGPNQGSKQGPRLPIGLMLAGSEMVTFTVIGLVLDYFLGTMPGFTIGLTLLGVVAAFFQLTQMAKALTARNKKARQSADKKDDAHNNVAKNDTEGGP